MSDCEKLAEEIRAYLAAGGIGLGIRAPKAVELLSRCLVELERRDE